MARAVIKGKFISLGQPPKTRTCPNKQHNAPLKKTVKERTNEA